MYVIILCYYVFSRNNFYYYYFFKIIIFKGKDDVYYDVFINFPFPFPPLCPCMLKVSARPCRTQEYGSVATREENDATLL